MSIISSTGNALLDYQLVRSQEARLREVFERQPGVTRTTESYREDVVDIRNADDLLDARDALSVTLSAHQLEDQLDTSRGLIRKIIEEPIDDRDSLVNRLVEQRYRALATTLQRDFETRLGTAYYDFKVDLDAEADTGFTFSRDFTVKDSGNGSFQPPADHVVRTEFVNLGSDRWSFQVFADDAGPDPLVEQEVRFDPRTGEITQPPPGPDGDVPVRVPAIDWGNGTREQFIAFNLRDVTQAAAGIQQASEARGQLLTDETPEEEGFAATGLIDLAIDLDSDAADGTIISQKADVFDADGNRHELEFIHRKISGPVWDFSVVKPGADDPSGNPLLRGEDQLLGNVALVFTPEGNIASPPPDLFGDRFVSLGAVDFGTGADANEIKINMTNISAREPGVKGQPVVVDGSGALFSGDTFLDRLEEDAVTNEFEKDLGSVMPGIREALFFRRNIMDATDINQVLANPVLSEVVRVAIGLPQEAAALDYDKFRSMVEDRFDLKDLQSDPEKMEKFIERYLVLNDLNSGRAGADPILGLFAPSGGGGGGGGGLASLLA